MSLKMPSTEQHNDPLYEVTARDNPYYRSDHEARHALDYVSEITHEPGTPFEEYFSENSGDQPPKLERSTTPERKVEAIEADSEANYKPKTFKFWMVMLGMYLSVFIVALDRTIVSVAIPESTDQFHSLNDVGWYASAYMITGGSSNLVSGKIYEYYSIKSVFLGSVVLFEAGSALCGAAPNSISLIIGRAIAGLGSSGIFMEE